MKSFKPIAPTLIVLKAINFDFVYYSYEDNENNENVYVSGKENQIFDRVSLLIIY